MKALSEEGLVAVIRLKGGENLLNISSALSDGGVKALEITMTTPGTLAAIEKASQSLSEGVIIGAGTVLDAETCRLAILAGARFIVSPVLDTDLAAMCKRYDVAYVAGAMTPGEVLRAVEAGADVVKVFPVTKLGPSYIKDLLGPFPTFKLAPTGGIDVNNLGRYLSAGACFVGVGRALVNEKMIEEKRWDDLSALAKEYAVAVKTSRTG